MAELILSSPLIYILFGFAPSLIWLLFYLREDAHPEPNRLVIQVFVLGMISAGLAAGLEYLMLNGFRYFNFNNLVAIVLGVSIIEEYVKYLVVKIRILRDPDFDEPIDAMIYMIIAALGFAAVENVLFVTPVFQRSFADGFSVIVFRFLGATFLHTLASAMIGFGLAAAILHKKSHGAYLKSGFLAAVGLHATYNYFILQVGNSFLVAILLLAMAAIVFQAFKILRQQHFMAKY